MRKIVFLSLIVLLLLTGCEAVAEHEWGPWHDDVDNPPTCTHDGLKASECVICDAVRREYAPQKSHIFDSNNKCSECGAFYIGESLGEGESIADKLTRVLTAISEEEGSGATICFEAGEYDFKDLPEMSFTKENITIEGALNKDGTTATSFTNSSSSSSTVIKATGSGFTVKDISFGIADGSNNKDAVLELTGDNVTISGCDFSLPGSVKAIGDIGSGKSVTLDGVNINGGGNITTSGNLSIKNNSEIDTNLEVKTDKSSLSVEDSTINGSVTATGNPSSLDITRSVINGDVDTGSDGVDSVSISGGTINSTSSKIKGKTVSVESGSSVNGEVEITSTVDGVVNIKESSVNKGDSNKSLTVKGESVSLDGAELGGTVTVNASSDVSMTNSTKIESGSNKVKITGKSVSVESGSSVNGEVEITSTGDSGVSIKASSINKGDSTRSLTITGDSLVVDGSDISGAVTVTTTQGTEIKNNSSVDSGNNSLTITGKSISVTGDSSLDGKVSLDPEKKTVVEDSSINSGKNKTDGSLEITRGSVKVTGSTLGGDIVLGKTDSSKAETGTTTATVTDVMISESSINGSGDSKTGGQFEITGGYLYIDSSELGGNILIDKDVDRAKITSSSIDTSDGSNGIITSANLTIDESTIKKGSGLFVKGASVENPVEITIDSSKSENDVDINGETIASILSKDIKDTGAEENSLIYPWTGEGAVCKVDNSTVEGLDAEQITIKFTLGTDEKIGNQTETVEVKYTRYKGSTAYLNTSTLLEVPTKSNSNDFFLGWKKSGADNSTAARNISEIPTDDTSFELVAVWQTVPKEGGTVTLGSYNGKGIVWKVLEVDGTNKRALLLMQNVLGPMKLSDQSRSTVYKWSISSLRTWLNSEFITSYLKDVPIVSVSNTTEQSYGTSNLETTSDKVFLLSKSEFEEKYKSYCSETYIYTLDGKGTNNWWWLRTPNPKWSKYAAYSVQYGKLTESHCGVDVGDRYVRPAFWYYYGGTVTTYNITYDLDGGSYAANGSYPTTYKRSTGEGSTEFKEAVTIKNPTKNGYEFVGWVYNTNNVLTPSTGNTGVCTVEASVTGNLNLKAVWKKTYTITYSGLDSGDTSSERPSSYVRYSTAVGSEWKNDKVTISSPTKSESTFDGWTVNVNGLTTEWTAGSGESFEISVETTGNITLTAKWTATSGTSGNTDTTSDGETTED